jgi:hypothetical protein
MKEMKPQRAKSGLRRLLGDWLVYGSDTAPKCRRCTLFYGDGDLYRLDKARSEFVYPNAIESIRIRYRQRLALEIISRYKRFFEEINIRNGFIYKEQWCIHIAS